VPSGPETLEARLEERARKLAKEYLRTGIEDAERHAQETHGDEQAEEDPTPPQDLSRAEKDAEVRRVFGGNKAPPGIDPEVFRMTNDAGYRRKIRQHLWCSFRGGGGGFPVVASGA
jgi:hypothetical protein